MGGCKPAPSRYFIPRPSRTGYEQEGQLAEEAQLVTKKDAPTDSTSPGGCAFSTQWYDRTFQVFQFIRQE
jgi:hypothetical protein